MGFAIIFKLLNSKLDGLRNHICYLNPCYILLVGAKVVSYGLRRGIHDEGFNKNLRL